MAAVEKPRNIKLKAWIDDAVAPVIGRRLFTNVMTDSSLHLAVKNAKRANKGPLGPKSDLLERAAKAFNSVERIR